MDVKTKQIVLELIKSVKIGDQYASEKPDRRKWFRFGSYDALRTLSQKVIEYEEQKIKEKV